MHFYTILTSQHIYLFIFIFWLILDLVHDVVNQYEDVFIDKDFKTLPYVRLDKAFCHNVNENAHALKSFGNERRFLEEERKLRLDLDCDVQKAQMNVKVTQI